MAQELMPSLSRAVEPSKRRYRGKAARRTTQSTRAVKANHFPDSVNYLRARQTRQIRGHQHVRTVMKSIGRSLITCPTLEMPEHPHSTADVPGGRDDDLSAYAMKVEVNDFAVH
jgi:hypothetical protein